MHVPFDGWSETSFRAACADAQISEPAARLGEIMADAGEDLGIIYADLDLSLVESTRARVPSILSKQSFSEP